MATSYQNKDLDFDSRLLSEFLYALNITRRQVLSYPAGHPLVANAATKLIEILPRLLEFRYDLTFGVARDTLLVEGHVMDVGNPVFRDLARSLFSLRIISLTINRELSETEICRFFSLLNQQSEKLAEAGGVELLLSSCGFKGIKAQGIDFSAFGATEMEVVRAPNTKVFESDTALLWKAFANGIILGSIDPEGQKSLPLKALDPVLLAEVMNRSHDGNDAALEKSYEQAITAFLKESDQNQIRGQAYRKTLGCLGDMAGKLKPELRKRFLNSVLKTCVRNPAISESLLSQMPQKAVLEAFEQLDSGAIQVPQMLLDVLGRLAESSGGGPHKSQVAGAIDRSVDEAAQQLTTLFCEDRSEYFVPRDYRDALALLSVAKVDHSLDKPEVDALLVSLEGFKIEEHFSAILIDLLERGVDQLTCEAIAANLNELAGFFLETGDFKSLAGLYSCLLRQSAGRDENAPGLLGATLQRFKDEGFAEAVLGGLDTWGKPVHEAAQFLIDEIGFPFAAPLLERLADEPSMSRRRFFMRALARIGPPVKDAIAPCLDDHRWYFIRNMVAVLREINDPAVLPLLGRLSGHSHPKVRFEVMNTFLHYGDDRANQFLLKELASRNPVNLLSATRLAASSSDERVVLALARLLNARLPTECAVEVKAGVIKALQTSASERILPEVTSFLLGKKLFSDPAIRPLKIKAVDLLEKIGTIDAGIVAGKLAQSTSGELSVVAEAVLMRIHRKLT